MSSGVAPPSQAAGTAAERDTQYERFIDQRLERTRRQVKSVDMVTWVVAVVVGVLGYLMVAALADHWLVSGGLGFLGRLLLWIVLVSGTSYALVRCVLPLVLYRINPVFAAYSIEQSRPSFKNGLISFLLLRRERGQVEQEELAKRMYHGLAFRTASELSHVSPEAAVDRTPLLRLCYAMAVLVALCCGYLLFSPKNPLVSFGRVMWPWAAIDAPTRVTIRQVEPGDTEEAYQGESVVVSAEVFGVRSAEPVTLLYSTLDGQTVDQAIAMTLPEQGHRYRCEVPAGSLGLQQDLRYRLEAGDCTTRWYEARMQVPLSIVVESVEYRYPEYMGLEPRRVERQGDLLGPEGTEVTLRAKASQPIEQAHVEFDGDARKAMSMESHLSDATARLVLRMDAKDPTQPEHGSYQLRFLDARRRENRRPVRHRIEVIPDLKPEIHFVDRPDDQVRVPLGGTLELKVRAEDRDFGLRRVLVHAERDGRSLAIGPLLSRLKPAKAQKGPFEGRCAFSPATLGLQPGDRVLYWAEAEDNKEDAKGPIPNRAETTKQWIVVAGDEKPPTSKTNPPEGKQSPDRKPPPSPDKKNPAKPEEQPKQDPNQPKEQGKEPPGAQGKDPSAQPKPDEKSPGKGDPKKKPSGPKEPDSPQKPKPKPGDNQAEGDQDQGPGDQGGDKGKQEGKPGGGPQGKGDPQAKPSGASSAKSKPGEAGPDQAGSDQANTEPTPSGQGDANQDAASQDAASQAPVNRDTDPGEAMRRILEHGDKQAGGDKGKTSPEKPAGAEAGKGPTEGQGSKPAGETGKGPTEGQEAKKPAGEPEKGPTEGQGPKPPAPGKTEKGPAEGQGPKPPAPGKTEKGPTEGQGPKPSDVPGDSAEAAAKPGAGQEGPEKGSAPGPGGEEPGTKAEKKKKPSPGPGQAKPMPGGGEPDTVPQEAGSGVPPAEAKPTPRSDMPVGARPAAPDPVAEKPSPSADPPADVAKPKPLRAKSDTGGDKAAEGAQGAGQKSDRRGTDSPGSNAPSDQGDGKADQPGKGELGKRGGNQGAAGKAPTTPGRQGKGQGPGDPQPGEPEGSDASKPEAPNANANANAKAKAKPKPDGPDAESPKTDPLGAKEPGGKDSGVKGKSGAKNPVGKQGQPGQPGDPNSGTPEQKGGQPGSIPGGGGAEPGDKQDRGTESPKAVPTPVEDPNLEYARRQTELALRTLAEDLAKEKPELLDRLGWSRGDAEKFYQQWLEMMRTSKEQGPKGDAARKDLNKALRSLGLRPQSTQLRESTGPRDRVQQQDAGRFPPPPEWAEQYRAYTKGMAEQK